MIKIGEITLSEKKTPIEIALGVDDKGMTTAKKLYEFLELDPKNYSRWCRSNIVNNEFAEENQDYFPFFINEECGGQASTDYKLTAHFAKKLSMKGNGERAEQAREYFTTLEEKTKELAINRSELSPQMQMLMSMVETQARQEIEQKRQAEEIKEVKQTMTTMKEIMVEPIGDWRQEINTRVRAIATECGITYQSLYVRMYAELETTAHCSLKRLQENKKARMEKAGNTKTAIKKETSAIAIIQEKPTLKAIFEDIVKMYAMKYLT